MVAGLPVPRGFVVCASAFGDFLDASNGAAAISELAAGLDVQDDSALAGISERLRGFILSTALPAAIEDAIRDAYSQIGQDAPVAVRSSAVSEDGEAASFAGQQETFLNIRGAGEVTRSVRECWASFFTPRALFYRAHKGTLADTRMAVVVQEMVLAARSGVMFTIDPVEKRRDRLVIEAVFGLGEGIVSGLITPDHYVVDRKSGAIVREFIATQPVAIVHDAKSGGVTRIDLTEQEGAARVLTAAQLNALREMGPRLEAFFGSPQDVEWCLRGEDMLLLQSRPITTL